MEEIIQYQKEKNERDSLCIMLCALMDKRTLIMLESKHYLTVTIIWTKTAIASIMMRGTPEIKINWNASIVLIALNVFVIRSKNKNTKIH